MSLQINVQDAKNQLSALLSKVEAGEEIIIARANKPIARLVPYHAHQLKRHLGEAKGLVEMADDFDALPDEFIEHFR